MNAWKKYLIGLAAACCLAVHGADDLLGEAAKTYRLLARDIAHWNETRPWTRGATSAPKYQPPAEEAFNRQALIWPEDRDPLDVLLRRTRALYEDLQSGPNAQTVFAQDGAALAALEASAAKTPVSDADARFALFLKAMRLRRAIAFKNPLLKSIDTGQNFWIILISAVAVFIIVQVIIDMIITPKIMGKAMGLNPAILLLSLSVWGALLGFIGLIIALPLTTLIIAYYKRYVTKEEDEPDPPKLTKNKKSSAQKVPAPPIEPQNEQAESNSEPVGH